MSKCVRDYRPERQATWCSRQDARDAFGDVHDALKQAGENTCLKCASAIYEALRGRDPDVDIKVNRGLLVATVARVEALVLEMPTSERVFNLAATLMLVAAELWLRFHQPEGAQGFIPLDEEYFTRLANSMYLGALRNRS